MLLLRTFSTPNYFSSFIAQSYIFSYLTIFSGALAKIYFFDSSLIKIFTNDYFFYSELAVIKTLIVFFWFILVFFLINFHYNEFFENNEFKLFSIDLSLCGALFLVDSTNLVEIFLALELIAFPTYTLISLEKNKESTEAALKYFIYSVYASLMLIISFIILFVYSGQNSFLQSIIMYADSTKLELAGFLFFIAFMVKLGIGPFYHWAPPVYQAISSPIFIFISTVSKIPLLVVFVYLSKTSFFITGNWSFFCIISLLVIGAFMSARDLIGEKNIRRIIAYTSNINFTIGILGFFFGFFNINIFIIYIGFYLFSNFSFYVWHLILNSNKFAKQEIAKLELFKNEDNFSKFIINVSVIINSGLPPITLFFFKIVIIGNISFINPTINFNLLPLFVSSFILLCSLSSYFAYFNIAKSLNYKETITKSEVWPNKKNLQIYIFANFTSFFTIALFFKLIFII